MSARPAFTLIETLAAVALLGLLAAAAVPLALRLGRGELAVGERWQARQALRELAAATPARAGDAAAGGVAGHAGWWVRSTLLAPDPVPPPPPGVAPAAGAPHHWRQLAICRGQGADTVVLAESLVVELDREEPTAAADREAHDR